MSNYEHRAELAHLNLQQAVHHAVKEYPGGVPAIAGIYGHNANTLQHKLNPANPTWINLREFEEILIATRSALVLDAVGRIAHCAWIDLGAFHHAGDLDVLETINELVQSVGRMCGALHQSLADGEVDKFELARLENHLAQLTGCGAAVIELAKKYVRD